MASNRPSTMQILLKLQYSKFGWATISGLWKISQEVKIVKCLHDGAPILISEPIALVEVEDSAKIVDIVNIVEEYSSISTIVSFAKYMLGIKKRVFATVKAIGKLDEDKLKACLSGALDGIVPVPYKPDVNMRDVNIVNLDVSSEPGYVYVKLEELNRVKGVSGKIHGVIVEFNTKPSLETVLNVRDYVFRHVGTANILLAVSHLLISKEILKRLKEFIEGIVITSFGKVLTVDFTSQAGDMFMYRCSNCRLDILSRSSMKKCPHCNDRVTEMLKLADQRLFSYSPRELKFINLDFMSKFVPEKYRIEVR